MALWGNSLQVEGLANAKPYGGSKLDAMNEERGVMMEVREGAGAGTHSALLAIGKVFDFILS